jgi:serine/threonine-protein kinase
VGSVFARRYRIDTCLGKGGMGAVYGVTDQQTGQGLALKVLAEKKGEKDEQVTRFFREAKASMKLASEHLVRVFEVGTADELPYMLMEHLRGEDLSEVTKNGGSAEPAIVAGWTVEVCEALAHAHAVGIIHRDIKPSNLFLCEATGAEPARIKVLDFGISKMTSREEIEKTATLTGGSSLIGSPQYISPEQLRDPRSVDARADIWSLGVVMYRMLSGRLPFDGDTLGTTFVAILEREPSPIGAGVPVLLEGIVRRCLSKKREDRYASVAELARDLVPVAGPYYESYVERIAMVLAPSSGSATVGRMRSAPSVPARPQVGPKPGDPSTLTLDGDDAELSAIRARSTPSSSPLPAAASAPPAPGAPYASFAPAPFASGAPSPYASFAHQFTPTPGSVSLPVIPGPAPLPSTMGPVSFGDPMAARRSSRAPLVASMAALALLVVGAIAAKTMASGGRDQATSAGRAHHLDARRRRAHRQRSRRRSAARRPCGGPRHPRGLGLERALGHRGRAGQRSTCPGHCRGRRHPRLAPDAEQTRGHCRAVRCPRRARDPKAIGKTRRDVKQARRAPRQPVRKPKLTLRAALHCVRLMRLRAQASSGSTL